MRRSASPARLVIAVLIALAGSWQSSAGQNRSSAQKPRVGYGDIVSSGAPSTPEAMWKGANVVVEALALNHGAAFERNPTAPPRYKMAWTPAFVEVKRVYKDESNLSVKPGMRMWVLQPFGKVEGPDYYIDNPGKEEFEIGEQHFVFLRCASDVNSCEVCAFVLAIRGETLKNDRAPSETSAIGTTSFRNRLAALAAKKGEAFD